MELRAKVAVVTGASKGIGRQVALDLARDGAVVAAVARSKELLDTLHAELVAHSPASTVHVCDVADGEAVRETIGAIEGAHGAIDVLVNNAGVEERRPIWEVSPADVARVMDVNFGGVVAGTLAAIPGMIARGAGVIVNVSSGAGRSPVPAEAAYGASKAAVIAFSESISYDLATKGIRVHVLFPGYVGDTPMARGSAAAGQKPPPQLVHRSAAQVSRALRRGLGGPRFEINAARLETFAPVARALTPRIYRRSVLRTQPL